MAKLRQDADIGPKAPGTIMTKMCSSFQCMMDCCRFAVEASQTRVVPLRVDREGRRRQVQGEAALVQGWQGMVRRELLH